MDEFLLSQLIAAVALACSLLTFQLKRREHILFVFAALSAALSLHFYILGSTAASAVVAVSVVRFLVSIRSQHRAWMYVFLLLTAAVGFITYSEPLNLLAILAGLLGVIATFQRDDLRLRRIMLSSSGTMAIHDLIVWTPVGLAVDLTAFISNIVGLYRFYRVSSSRRSTQ